MIQVTVRFGSETFPRSYPAGSNIGAVIGDHNLKAVAGWGDNVRALISGVEQPVTALVPNGATIVIETRANTKAS